MRRCVPHIVENKHSETSRFCIDTRVNGKRVRQFFATQKEAEKVLKEITAKIRREGEAALDISDSVRIEASESAKKLAPFPGATITKAVDFYVTHLLLLQKSVPIRQLVTEYMAEKANDTELSATYRSDLRLRFDRFCRTFSDTGTRDLTTQQIKEWLWSLKTPDGRR